MIIANGTVAFMEEAAGVIDPETGYRTSTSTEEAYGTRIPCQYNPLSLDLTATTAEKEDYTEEQYEIFVEEMIPVMNGRLLLRRLDDTIVGTFNIRKVEQLEAVCETRITV